MEQIDGELRRNFSFLQREMELKFSLLEQKYLIKEMAQNMTISNQRQEIAELKKHAVSNITSLDKKYTAIVMELNQTVLHQRQKIASLEQQQERHTHNITEVVSNVNNLEKTIYNENHLVSVRTQGLAEHLNQSLSAYELLLYDVVEKLNKEAELFENQTRNTNINVTNLVKQLRYLSLSIDQIDNRLTSLNTSLTGKNDTIIHFFSVSYF